jgi:hypothetical protein
MDGEQLVSTIVAMLLSILCVIWIAFLVTEDMTPPYYFAAAVLSIVFIGLLTGFIAGRRVRPEPPRDIILLALGDMLLVLTIPFLIAGGFIFALASVIHAAGLLVASAGIAMAFAYRMPKR